MAVKKIRSFDEIRLDVVEALKRAYIKRGFIPRAPKPRQEQNEEVKDSKPKESQSEEESKKTTKGEDVSLTTEQEPQEVHEKLIDITEKAQDVLFKSDTVFPFTLFPDTITLDREKLTVATRYFFRVAKIVSVPVNSISSAEVDVGPFFGSLHMASKFFVQNKYTVNFLSRENAIELHSLLQGFMIANEKNIDVTDIDKRDLLILLKDLGQGVKF